MSGVITWSDLVAYHEKVAPHMDFRLLLEMVRVLEPEDRAIEESKNRPRKKK